MNTLLDVCITVIVRSAEALNMGGFVAFAMAAAFCAGAYVATVAVEKASGRWSR